MKHLNITVIGRVQGVFFRAATREKADELGIHGFVRNQDDGSVYLEAEAPEEALGDLVEWLEDGPPAASVEELIVHEDEIRDMEGFEIRS